MKLTASIVRKMDLARAPRDVLLELLFLARGRCCLVVTQEAVAERLGLSRKTVTRAMIALRELGLVETERKHRTASGHRGADKITFVENSWAIVPVKGTRLRDKMSPRDDAAKGTECPLGLRDKMSQLIESNSKGGDRDQHFGHRAEDVSSSQLAHLAPANDAARLTLIPGGRAA